MKKNLLILHLISLLVANTAIISGLAAIIIFFALTTLYLTAGEFSLAKESTRMAFGSGIMAALCWFMSEFVKRRARNFR